MKNLARSLCSLAAALAPATAFAHPGHGATDPESVTHYLADPLHAAVLGIVVAPVIVTAVGLLRRRRPATIR